MQTDVKIGVVVGVLLAAVVIIYFVVGGSGPASQEDENILGSGELRPSSKANRLVRNEPPKPAATKRIGRAKLTEPTKVAKKRAADAVITAYAAKPAARPAAKPAATETPAISAKIAAKSPGADEVLVVMPKATERTTPRTYTVTESDYGFWPISQKVYGDGKHYKLIAQANPDVTTATLRTGKVLRIPPLSARALSPAATPTPVADIAPRPGEQTTYKVQSGDAGFWGISKKVYGQGKYFYLIRRANPGVDSMSLRPGQTLIIPSRPVIGTTGRILTARPTAAAQPIAAPKRGAGERTYVVEHGDAGFWGVAQKVYGEGKYMYLIKRANPTADSNKLMPGQKLIIPPLTDDILAAARKARQKLQKPKASPADSTDVADNRPYFEEY